MWKKCFGLVRAIPCGVLCVLIPLAGGCKKSEPTSATKSTGPDRQVPARIVQSHIHWLGKKRIAAETNAAGLMRIWNLPESARLEAQTLDKLALGLVQTNRAPITNYQAPITNFSALLAGPSAQVRPLLTDLLLQESYLEIQTTTNHIREVALAIRLDEDRAALWSTNLASVLLSLTGVTPTPTPNSRYRWQTKLQPSGPAIHVDLIRAADWTILALREQEATLGTDLLDRIARYGAPFPPPATNFWIEAENLDTRSLPGVFDLNILENLPKISLTVIGDGENVRTRGQFKFPKPLPLQLDPWQIPTNLISQPLVSFTAIRGIAPWLSSLKAWKDLQVISPPNQLYIWAQEGAPMLTYFAAPASDASNLVYRLADRVLENGSSFFATNDRIAFRKGQGFNGLQWTGAPFISPFLRSTNVGGGDFLFGGVFQPSDTNSPPPPELLQQILNSTNLVCYDWEITGPRSQQVHYLGLFLCFSLWRDQMWAHFVSSAWLKAISPNLGNCGTLVTLTAPNELSFVRKSTLGCTSLELNLLADWLESPNFPLGLHSFVPAAPDVPIPPTRRLGTNNPASSSLPQK